MKVSTVSIVYETFALTLMYMHTQVLVPLALIVLLFRRGMVQIWYECIFSEKVFCFVPLHFTKMQEFEGEYDIPDKYTGRYVFYTSVVSNSYCNYFSFFRLEQDFHIGGLLGKGGFAHVYEVRSKTDGGSYALKIVKLPNKYA